MQDSEYDNRRTHQRVPMGCEVQLHPLVASFDEAAECSHDSESRDISAGGMRVWSDRLYPLHARLLLAFECDARDWPSVTSRVGSVVWCSPLPAREGCLLGIKFGDDEDQTMPWDTPD